jgi:hypothetical protein
MITLNEVIDAVSKTYNPKNLMVREDKDVLTINCNGSTTKIFNWKNTPISQILNVVGGKTLNEGYSGELLLG